MSCFRGTATYMMGSFAGQKRVKMDIYAQYFLNYSPKLENIDPVPPKPQNTDI